MMNVLTAHSHVPVPYARAADLVIFEQRTSAHFHLTSPVAKIAETACESKSLPAGHPDIFNWHQTSILVALGLEGASEP